MSKLLLSLWVLVLAGCAGVAPTPRAVRPLRVASDLDNRPFAWVDERGEPQGRDVEMMRLLARELGVELEWSRMPFDALLPACERGDVDVVCATLGITAERARRVRFSKPYFTTEIAVVVRSEAGEPRTLGDLDGRRVAGSPGTTSESAVRERLPRATGVFEGSKDTGPVKERLLSRSIDAAVMDAPAARVLVEESAGQLTLFDEALASEHYALAFPTSRADLAADFDRALTRLGPQLDELDRRFGLAR